MMGPVAFATFETPPPAPPPPLGRPWWLDANCMLETAHENVSLRNCRIGFIRFKNQPGWVFRI